MASGDWPGNVGATAFGNQFRMYSIGTVAVLLTFGVLTFIEAPRLQANLPPPRIGLFERINISVFLLWVVVVATVLWRTGTSQRTSPNSASPAPGLSASYHGVPQ